MQKDEKKMFCPPTAILQDRKISFSQLVTSHNVMNIEDGGRPHSFSKFEALSRKLRELRQNAKYAIKHL